MWAALIFRLVSSGSLRPFWAALILAFVSFDIDWPFPGMTGLLTPAFGKMYFSWYYAERPLPDQCLPS